MTPFVQTCFDEEEIQKTADGVVEHLLSSETVLMELFDGRSPSLSEVREHAVAFVREQSDGLVFVNDEFQVVIREANIAQGWPRMLHLSIKRIDREIIHEWRKLQQIKNELVGEEHEAVELYPAESRLVDAANQYHLWVLADPKQMFPFGFTTRAVGEGSLGKSKQRPMEAKT